MIKSAANAASLKTKIQDPAEPADDDSAGGRRVRLGSPGFPDFGLRGGCASSRLDQGLKVKLEIEGSGSENKFVYTSEVETDSKPQNNTIYISHAPEWPPDAKSRTLEQIKKNRYCCLFGLFI